MFNNAGSILPFIVATYAMVATNILIISTSKSYMQVVTIISFAALLCFGPFASFGMSTFLIFTMFCFHVSFANVMTVKESAISFKPPLMPKYFSGCNLKVQFHIMSYNIQANNMFERFLILSISLPDTAYPNHLPSSRIQDMIWPDTYQYEYDVSSRTTKKIHGTIWQAHRLKAIPTKSDPILLESVIIPPPIESLRFRTSYENLTWSEPANFHPDDEGNMSLKQTANYQLVTSR